MLAHMYVRTYVCMYVHMYVCYICMYVHTYVTQSKSASCADCFEPCSSIDDVIGQ